MRGQLSYILEIIDIIKEYLIEGDNVEVTYFDFSETFHMVSHYHLLVKMKNLVISPKYSKHCKIFLTDRTIKVKIGNNYSERLNITSGASQDSALGSCFF